ncbi:hypothetical protein [Endozoicomonas ascidiicola]|uniref:hypothetical protein n=1 Tax=Endozoicomonas ascidiicola TaxID=1698521 RepID=UPI00082E024E|nr:hypothetical protein [Endozoicomonas ascidiicola]
MQVQANQHVFSGQSVDSGGVGVKPEGNALQRFHYKYNPESGTERRWGNSFMTVAGFSAAGAAGLNYMASSLEHLGNQDGSIIERTVYVMVENPLVAGACTGFAGGALLVGMLRGQGLKPRTEEGVRFIMDGLIHKVEKSTQSIEQYKKTIDIHAGLLSQKKPLILQEKATNEQVEKTRYAKRMQEYQHKAGLVAGELKGYLDAVFERLNDPDRCPSYEETVSGRRNGGTFQLGQTVSGFFHNRNYSWFAQDSLKKALIPALTETELQKVDAIFAKFPWQPTYWPKEGPLEKEYRQLESAKKSDQRGMAEVQHGLSGLLRRYPLLVPDSDNQVKTPSLDKFIGYLPD